jgi:dihydrofolate reductase
MNHARRFKMAHLIYSANCSLDGYIEDANGNFDWTRPDDEVHKYINDLIRTVSTHLYGRRLYQTMLVWETDPSLASASPLMADFAELWQAAEKIVYSKTLPAVPTRQTRIERDFDPEAIRRLKEAATQDILIGGANLAAQAFRAGLIDECHFFVAPTTLGGGKTALPEAFRLELELLDVRRFGGGVVHLHYRPRNGITA